MERKLPNLTFVNRSPFGISYYLMQHDQLSLCIEQRQTPGGVPSTRRSIIFYYNLTVLWPFFTTMRHLLSLYVEQ